MGWNMVPHLDGSGFKPLSLRWAHDFSLPRTERCQPFSQCTGSRWNQIDARDSGD